MGIAFFMPMIPPTAAHQEQAVRVEVVEKFRAVVPGVYVCAEEIGEASDGE